VFSLTSQRNSRSGRVNHHKYSESDVDFFLGYCQDDDAVYIIPHEETKERTMINLWILREPSSNKEKHQENQRFKNAFHLLV
jgi:hypothetical protein